MPANFSSAANFSPHCLSNSDVISFLGKPAQQIDKPVAARTFMSLVEIFQALKRLCVRVLIVLSGNTGHKAPGGYVL